MHAIWLYFYQDFEACNGIEEVAELIRDKQADENLRFPFCLPFFSVKVI